MTYEIAGPYSYGPEHIHRPLVAETPAGPRAVEWPVKLWNRQQPQMAGLGLVWDDSWFWPDTETPTYGTTTYAPYCQNIWPWVLGAAVVVMFLTKK